MTRDDLAVKQKGSIRTWVQANLIEKIHRTIEILLWVLFKAIQSILEDPISARGCAWAPRRRTKM